MRSRNDPYGAHDVELVCDWPDRGFGAGWLDQGEQVGPSSPWLLVEDAGDGCVATGPVLGRGWSCPRCYLRRRAASTWPIRGLRQQMSPAQHDSVRTCSRSLSDRHVVVGPGGEVRSTHLLIPVPSCPCASRPQPIQFPQDYVSERLGIVQRIEQHASVLHGLVVCVAVAADTRPVLGQSAVCHGVAVGHDVAATRARAVGECLERYAAAAVPDPGPAGEVHVPTATLSGRPGPDLPGHRVFLPFRHGGPPGFVQTSTGLAAGPSLVEALQHAAAETAERHVFMRAWRAGGPATGAAPEASDPPGMRVVQLPTDLPVLVAVAGFERAKPPYCALGLGSGWTWAEARQRSLLEACAALDMLGRLDLTAVVPWPPRTLEQHALAHAVVPGLRAARDRLLSAPEGPPPPERRATDRWSAYRRARGDDLVAELTTPDVAAGGIRVVRVVPAPDFLDLSADGAAELRAGHVPHPVG